VVYVALYGSTTTPPTLRAYAGATGALLGSFLLSDQLNEGASGSPTLSADGSTVYVGSSDKNLYAVDVTAPATMKSRWKHTTGAKVDTRPLVAQSRVYAAGFDGFLHAMDAASGVRIDPFPWKTDAPFMADVTRSPHGTLYAGSLDESLYALDDGGKVLASYRLGRMQFTSPVPNGDEILAATTKPGRLHVLSADLKPKWSWEPENGDQFRASPVVVDGRILIGNTNGFLYALDATRGPR